MIQGTAHKSRPRSELLMRLVEPLAGPLAAFLARRRVNPLLIVAAHSLLGALAAALIAFAGQGWFALAAVLLFAKTLLDNVDGAVARLSGQVTLAGRYFDTGMDLLVNALLFAALTVHLPAWQPLFAFVLLTLLLSLDHNAERLYRSQRPSATVPEPVVPGQPLILSLFRQLYRLLLAPQDRLIERIEKRRFERLSGQGCGQAPREYRLAWWDLPSTAALVNLGLGTQLTLLAVALLLQQPGWYVAAVYLMALYATAVQLLRTVRFRAFLQRARSEQAQQAACSGSAQAGQPDLNQPEQSKEVI
jgi:phosphatidylglycerophosphate synthase